MESGDRPRSRAPTAGQDPVLREAGTLRRRAFARTDSWRRSLRRRSARRRRAVRLAGVDCLLLTLAAVASWWGASLAGVATEPLGWTVLYGALTLVGVALRGGYRFRLEVSPFEYVGQIVAGTATAAILVIAARVLLDPSGDIAGQGVRMWAFASINLFAARMGMAVGARRRSHGGLRTLIIGAGDIGRTVARRLEERPELGLRPVGFLDKEPRTAGEGATAPPLLGASWDLEDIVERHQVDHAIVAFSTAPHHVLLGLVRRCRALELEVSVVPRLFEEISRQVRVEHLGGIALLRVDQSDPRGWQFEVKYAIDRIVAAVALLFLTPLLALLAALVRFSSPGPIFFRQTRVGLDGRQFEVLKFRTMRVAPPDDQHNAGWARRQLGEEPESQQGSDRRTPVGRLLRRASFDELPQLLNVLRGEMSLIGPRPEMPGYVRAFEQHVHRYGDRHRVKSGLTGWAQVHGLRGDTSLVDRVEWDNYYIENWTLMLDLKILLLTPSALLSGE